jgi:FkbM family methyltransferase
MSEGRVSGRKPLEHATLYSAPASFYKVKEMKRRGGKPKNPCSRSYEIAKPYIDNFRTAIDIGCRHGKYTELLRNDFKAIECFEPRPTLPSFWENVGGKKKYKHKIRYYSCALGDVKKEVRMYGAIIHDDNWWKNTKTGRNAYENKSKLHKVAQKTLDSFGFKDVDFIKIDVEGHELQVLKGAAETISIYKPTIILEQNSLMKEWGKGEKFDGINFLKTLDYHQVAFDGAMDYIMKFCG